MRSFRTRRGDATAGAFVSAAAAIGLAVPGSASATQNPAERTQPVIPFRIAPGVYYVGTKGLAAYLVTAPQSAILLDGTLQENAPLIERNIETIAPLKQVKLVLSDHAHFDHVGAVARIKGDIGARFVASAGDALALRRGVPRGDTDYGVIGFPMIKVDQLIGDGQSVAVGGAVLTAHLTPGHTTGCTSWNMTVRDGNRRERALHARWRAGRPTTAAARCRCRTP